jgi:hypothetical protein
MPFAEAVGLSATDEARIVVLTSACRDSAGSARRPAPRGKSERIFRAVGLRADGEESDERVDAVGERDDRAGDVARQRVIELTGW